MKKAFPKTLTCILLLLCLTLLPLYAFGDIPVIRLKNFPKKPMSAKLSSSEISWIPFRVERSNVLASSAMYSSIQRLADLWLISSTTRVRYFGVTKSLDA